MILITGAAGKTGKAVLRKVAGGGGRVTAWVFREEQAEQVEMLGAEQVVVGDMLSLANQRRAMQGIDSVYHIPPNVHPDEIGLAKAIIDTAVEYEVTHFVYHSVLHPQIEAMPHHWKKMRAEEYLFSSGLPFTILQPVVYMQTSLANWSKIIETGKYAVPYAVNSRISMVDLEDVAEAAAKVLLEASGDAERPGIHMGATYELVGTPVMTPRQIAAILAEALDRPVVAEKLPLAEWKNGARNSGLGEYQIDALAKMFSYYEEHGFWGNPWVLSCLLNRPATSYKDFVIRETQVRSHELQ